MRASDVSTLEHGNASARHLTTRISQIRWRGGGGSHRIEMATEIQCTPPERQSSVFVTKKAEGARRALPLLPTSRVVRHARRNLACKLIEGAHGQRGQIISAGRRVLVEGLSQQVHVASCDQATNCWRNSACGLYIGTIRSTPVRGLRKGPSLFGPFLKASMVGFTLVTL